MTDREESQVRSTLREFGEFQMQRNVFAGQWEEAAELILPTSRNTFFFGSFNWQGQKKTDRQIDASGALALHRFCAIADSLVTPRNMIYDGIEAGGANADYIMKDRATRLWFEDTTRTLFRNRYASIGNFSAQNYNNWQSLGGFGNATMFVDKFDNKLQPGVRGLRYKCIPLGETFFGENHQGVVDRMIRWFRLTAYQAVQKWGREYLPAGMESALEQDSQYLYDFLHCVKPRDEDDYDPDRLDERGKPFTSYYIAVQGQCLMAPEGGYRKFPFSVSRYDQTPGEVYGRGPAQIVLPALKTLNAQKRVFLKQGHRAADPVLLTRDDGLINMDLRPGAMNPGGWGADGKPLVGVLPTGDIQISEKMMGEERGLIEDTFLVSLFKVLSEHPNMTATQVIELVNEKGMLVAPTLGRQHGERSTMVERELDLLSEQGLLSPMPPRLREARGEYQVVDKSPLALAARANQAAGFIRSVNQTGEWVKMTQDMSLFDPYDFDTALAEIAQIQNSPERWMADERMIAGKRQQRAKAVQQKQQVDAMPGQAAIMNAQAHQAKAGMQQPNQVQQQAQQPQSEGVPA